VEIEIASVHAPHAELRISMLAEAQHGLVTRRQLETLGLGRGAIEHRIAVGSLHRVRRGVYAVGHRALRPRAHILAVVLAAGPGVAVSHRSAAALSRIRRSASATVEITVPDRRRGPADARVHHAPLPPDQVTIVDGIPVTTVERTLLDLAAVLRPEALRHALEEAEMQVRPDWRVLAELVAAAGGRRGVRALRAILDERSVGTRTTKSGLERAFLVFLRRHGLPLPDTNAWIEGYEVDCVWRGARLIVELDSRLHLDHGKFERDRARDRALTIAGWRVVRVTWEHIHAGEDALHRDLVFLTTA
jgi:very-short-patch-repair endonuclease